VAIRDEAWRGFQAGAGAYERARPGYRPELMAWLVAALDLRPGRTVLDVGAGTGKLTRELVATGATVVAVEPVPGMRAILERAVPGASAFAGTAEALPLGEASVDAITAASAFHWFDAPVALAEFHRVLRRGGRLAMLWNRRRSDEPLHQAIDGIIEPYRHRASSHRDGSWRRDVERSGLFAAAAETLSPFEHELDPAGLVDRVSSISFISALPEPERESVLDRIRELAAGTPPPLRLGYITEAYVYERR
jgi:SAM-dependent methyltransferase